MTRSLSKRQTIVAFLALGWLGSFAIMFFGDYQVSNRWPTFSTALQFAGLALVFAPLLALFAAWKGGWLGARKKD